jgi:hypothetical protein
MTQEEKNGVQLLISNIMGNQILGFYALKALGWSATKISSAWIPGAFDNLEYNNNNRSVSFGREANKDLYFKIYEEFNRDIDNVTKSGSKVVSFKDLKRGWNVYCEYYINDKYTHSYIGAFDHGFNPLILKKHFTKYLKNYEKEYAN